MGKESALEQYEALHQAFVDFWEAVAKALSLWDIADALESWLEQIRLYFVMRR